MKRLGLLAALGLIPIGLAGCTRGSGSDIEKRLDKIDQRIAALEKSAGKGARGAERNRPQRQRPSRPDPSVTYGIPVGDSHYDGPKYAPVTMIEGFEFA